MRALLLIALTVARLACADAPPPIAVVPALLREDGVVTWNGDRADGAPTTLTLSLAVHVAGPGEVMELGQARLVSLTVDDGRVVPPGDDEGVPFAWRSMAMAWPAGARHPPPRAQLRLPGGVHGAKRIAKLVGSVPCTWAQARRRIRLAPLADHLGKRIRVAGVDGDPVVQVERTGDQVTLITTAAAARLLAGSAFESGDGKPIAANASGSGGQNGEMRWSWTLTGAGDDVALGLDWWADVHREDVAFTVTDVALGGDVAKPADDF